MKGILQKQARPQIVLFIVVLLAFFLRFWLIGINPPSLTWDEAAWGYNAYSLGIDGRDEFGKLLPLDYLESFGDFKPPVYAYLDILPIKIFGLNEFATRLPSAFFGTLTVLLSFFLVKRIFNASEHSLKYALFSAFLLAISPWHINLSRAAFEANVATFFLTLGVFLFLVALQKNTWYLVLSAVSFVLSFYTFNTARVVAPLLVVALALGVFKKLLNNKTQSLTAILVGLALIIPLVSFLRSPFAQLRFTEVNIFSDILVVQRSNQEIANDNNVTWSKIIHNRRLMYGVSFLKHYFDNLSPSFLFIKGDGNPKFSTQDVGQLYIWEIPFLIAGVLLMFKRKENFWWIIPLWFIIGIIPAATARETPHALRIEALLPTIQILSAYGVIQSWVLFQGRNNLFFYKTIIGFFSFFVVLNFVYYIDGYYVYYPIDYSSEWQYGYKDAFFYIEKEGRGYDRIYFTESLGRPYIYALFYLRYDPRLYRREARIRREAAGFAHVTNFGKYYFANEIMQLPKQGKILYIDIPRNVPKNANIKRSFLLLNGDPSLVAYTF